MVSDDITIKWINKGQPDKMNVFLSLKSHFDQNDETSIY